MSSSDDNCILINERAFGDLIVDFFKVLNALDFMVYQAKDHNLQGNDYVREASVAIADMMRVFYVISHDQLPMSQFTVLNELIEGRHMRGKQYIEWLKRNGSIKREITTRSWHLSLG